MYQESRPLHLQLLVHFCFYCQLQPLLFLLLILLLCNLLRLYFLLHLTVFEPLLLTSSVSIITFTNSSSSNILSFLLQIYLFLIHLVHLLVEFFYLHLHNPFSSFTSLIFLIYSVIFIFTFFITSLLPSLSTVPSAFTILTFFAIVIFTFSFVAFFTFILNHLLFLHLIYSNLLRLHFLHRLFVAFTILTFFLPSSCSRIVERRSFVDFTLVTFTCHPLMLQIYRSHGIHKQLGT